MFQRQKIKFSKHSLLVGENFSEVKKGFTFFISLPFLDQYAIGLIGYFLKMNV